MKEALVVVDMQSDFVSPDGALPVPDAESIIPVINTYIDHFSKQKELIILTRDWHERDDPEFEQFPPHCIRNTKGAEFHPGLHLPDFTVVFDKVTFDAFSNPRLEERLHKDGIEKLLVCGVATEICVQAFVESALDKNYGVTIIADGVKGLTQDASDWALELCSVAGATIREEP